MRGCSHQDLKREHLTTWKENVIYVHIWLKSDVCIWICTIFKEKKKNCFPQLLLNYYLKKSSCLILFYLLAFLNSDQHTEQEVLDHKSAVCTGTLKIFAMVHYYHRKHLCHAMLWLDHNSFFVHISFLLALPYTLSSLSPLFKPLFFWLAAPKLEKQRAVRQSEMNFLQRNVELKCPKSSPIFTSLNHCGNLCLTHKLETVMFKV